MPHIIKTLEDAKALEGTEIGVSNWILVDQERINKFADATDDHQWIHTDPERAAQCSNCNLTAMICQPGSGNYSTDPCYLRLLLISPKNSARNFSSVSKQPSITLVFILISFL